jgi:hypothetical protein
MSTWEDAAKSWEHTALKWQEAAEEWRMATFQWRGATAAVLVLGALGWIFFLLHLVKPTYCPGV